ncbi:MULTISPECIES: hypothetical protein [unclassified Bradyrhizobium]|uniref:hypothetical protein n=1 Tax=unclassified Bradyrhizobium TaxID=2631580 RepID=UPI00201B65EE|nr:MULTISPECIES: hypothetical protein [unclassified Bradyrhizobium]UQR61168.1 hypothetical protein LRP30_29940 [Bradyrhizobium sp. C-145]UWU90976.1 hypothetical protein N2604_31700 [Bradyrhizobium sp. CB1015]
MKVAFVERTDARVRRRRAVVDMILMIAPSDGTGAAATTCGGDFGGRCFMGSFKVSIC